MDCHRILVRHGTQSFSYRSYRGHEIHIDTVTDPTLLQTQYSPCLLNATTVNPLFLHHKTPHLLQLKSLHPVYFLTPENFEV